jgi:predicted nucleic acid-binding protein
LTTTIDSSVLIDVLTQDAAHGSDSIRRVEEARRHGRILVPPPVWAEVRAHFPDDRSMAAAMEEADLEFDPEDRSIADVAGAFWRSYRRAGGRRTRLLTDFLIAAHAMGRGGRLLTRDRHFYREYFRDLEILGPGT